MFVLPSEALVFQGAILTVTPCIKTLVERFVSS
jgi:hypothetical protein